MHISTQKKSFTYLGGKFSILPWLLPQLPITTHFVEVFGGSMVVTLNRPQSKIETYNDLNNKIVNFFKVLRSHPEELINALQLTPHSKWEYDNAWHSDADSEIEQARKFFIRNQQSIMAAGGQEKIKGWASATKSSRCLISERTNRWLKSVDNLYSLVDRLSQIQIECRDFRFIMKSYDTTDTLFYCDPPYRNTFRSSSKYEFDFNNQDFIDLHYWASKCTGKVAISGYDEPFMQDLFKDFRFIQGPLRKNGRSTKQAIECLWTNY